MVNGGSKALLQGVLSMLPLAQGLAPPAGSADGDPAGEMCDGHDVA